MNDIALIRLCELAQLDQLEALLQEMLNEAGLATERRDINQRLRRLNRLRAMWQYSGQPKGGNR